jgi:ABC-type multidrug transport system fused ATPase/permease subunit
MPPASWPTSGDLIVENLTARYSVACLDSKACIHCLIIFPLQDGPNVLHNLSFHLKHSECVGVVGRTGSGKVCSWIVSLSQFNGLLEHTDACFAWLHLC